jgi:hypothetical protein
MRSFDLKRSLNRTIGKETIARDEGFSSFDVLSSFVTESCLGGSEVCAQS